MHTVYSANYIFKPKLCYRPNGCRFCCNQAIQLQAFKDKDLKLVLKESLRTRTRTSTNIRANGENTLHFYTKPNSKPLNIDNIEIV